MGLYSMYATSLVTNERQGNKRVEHRVSAPSEQAIVDAIESLGAGKLTSVFIEGEDPAYLSVGADQGRYIVFATFDTQRYLSLANPRELSGKETLRIGGQETSFERKFIVDRMMAVECALAFARDGVLHEKHRWIASPIYS
jgi:hypothetical protein